jgi:gliding motility-associated-like protein
MNLRHFVQLLLLSTPTFLSLSAQNTLQTVDAQNGPYNAQSLVSNVFLGEGVEVLNVTYNGSPRAIGYFSGGTQSIGIERGIIMTSGYAAKPAAGFGPPDVGQNFASNSNGSSATDANLSSIATAAVRDVAVYTITFKPNSDILSFRYCFASEEYPEYSCTSFNDVFGFFIQGPNYPTPTNIAKIPNTNLPVSINNIHPYNDQNGPNPNPCLPFNAQYYNGNSNTTKQPVYDGYTDIFTATAMVIPCQTYTIKLAIADVFDSAYDSGVFLEARSFGTSGLRVAAVTPAADGSIAEGCSAATINFTIAQPQTQNFPINYEVLGSATPGVDFTSLPANLFIPAGQTQLSVNIPGLEDGLTEVPEDVIVRVKVDACNWDTVRILIKDNLLVPPAMQDTGICISGTPITLNATVPIQTPPPPTFSNNNSIPIPDNYPAVNSQVSVSGVQPLTLGTGVIRSVCVNLTHSYDDDIDLFLISPGGQVLELTTDNGASGDNYTNTCFTPSAAVPINFPGPQAPASAAPFTGNFQPEGSWSDLWDTPTRPSNGNWQLQAADDFPTFTGSIQNWSITFAPLYEVNYAWSAGVSCPTCPINTIIPAASSTYYVTATDIYGCSATDSVHVSVAQLSATAAVVSDVSCFGKNDGQLLATANIGGNNTYLWSDPAGQTTQTASGLAPGTYQVTISNPAGCTGVASATITEPPLLDLNANAANVTCFGGNNGSAQAQITGGTAPYQYLWSNGQTTGNPNGLAAGAYTVTVTDANGCTDAGQVNITQPSAIQLSVAQSVNVSCFGGNNGQISVQAQGGAGALAYLWSNGQTTSTATSLVAGSYTVTVTDSNGCTRTVSATLTQPQQLSVQSSQSPARCFGEANGEVLLTVGGGIPGYSALWQGPGGYTGSGLSITGVGAGAYLATVTDQNGCNRTLTASVAQPDVLALNIPAVADTICFQSSTGTVSAVASGGNGGYTYTWNNGQSGPTAAGLVAGTYQVTATDIRGCLTAGQSVVPQKEQLSASALAVQPRCHDGEDGYATVNNIRYGASAASPAAFQYVWNTTPAQTSQTAINLKADQSYAVTVTDQNGCSATYSFSLGNPAPVLASITGKNDVLCNGDPTGWASAKATGGTAPYTWKWANSSTPADSVGRGLLAGTNKVTISDAFGCNATATVEIKEPTRLIGQAIPSHVKCYGERSGSASITAFGGVAPYKYIWWNGVTGTQVTGLPAGEIGVTVTDANGCATPVITEILQPEIPISGQVILTEPTCYGYHDGRIQILPSGGSPPYRYALNNKPWNGSSVQIGLYAGLYIPRIADANGCTVELPVTQLNEPASVSADLGPDLTIEFGEDAQLFLEVFNAVGNYSVQWAPEDTSLLNCTNCIDPLVEGLTNPHYFDAEVTDQNGCRASDQVLIQVIVPRKVYVPTAFSPNGDSVNDLLLVHGQNESRALTFRVYDRWGEMVYEATNFDFNDENIGWDGNFRGQPMNPAVFVWVLEAEFADGHTEVFRGNTTLVR